MDKKFNYCKGCNNHSTSNLTSAYLFVAIFFPNHCFYIDCATSSKNDWLEAFTAVVDNIKTNEFNLIQYFFYIIIVSSLASFIFLFVIFVIIYGSYSDRITPKTIFLCKVFKHRQKC